MKSLNYKHTITACFIGYVVQAIVCNYAPLLFVSWEQEFNISIAQLTVVVTLTFFTQIAVDLISAKYAERVGYRRSLIISHLCAFTGFILLGILPYMMSNAFAGIIISVIIYSVGSGILEVLISPVVEACPTDNKAGAMSLLHSFYCWGAVAVIAFSTLFFSLFGRENWRYLAFIWAVFSLLNGVFFIFVPVAEPKENKEAKASSPFKEKFFYAVILLMICAGASEQAMSQWASTFAETGLGVSKAVGDLAGPAAFAVLMGSGRVLFSKLSNKIKIEKYLFASALLCIVAYLLASFSQNPVIALIGCALCGFSVAAMWPGTISLSTKRMPNSTVLFAFLALAGDIGCTGGPTLIGIVTDTLGGSIKQGLIFAILFPVIIVVTIFLSSFRKKN